MNSQPQQPIEPVPADAPSRPLVAVLGPTGSGKSVLALEIAENFGGEIINCDSLQVYRHFDVGTAKLPFAARRGIPHHLIDLVDPDDLFTAGAYSRVARDVIREISSRSRLPIIAGGTGFYLRALLEGLFPGPARSPELRARLAARETRKRGSLHRLLTRFDSPTARKIHPHDVPKVMRALEVCLLARRPVSDLFRQERDSLRGYAVLKIGLLPGRDELYRRLDERCAQMFETGLIEEVQHILALGFPASAKPFESHGYKQALQFLRGELTLKEAIYYAQRNTRHYAKRQITWFRRETDLKWIKNFGDAVSTRTMAFDLLREHFAKLQKNPWEHF